MNEEKDNSENPLAMTLAKGAGDESFPVLKAFQDYLEQERERARRRVVTLSVCFISAIVVLVLLFGIIFAIFFGHMIRNNEQQQNRLFELYARSGSLPVAAAPVAAPVPVAPPASAVPAPAAQDDQVRRLLDRIRRLEAGPASAPVAAPTPAVAAVPQPETVGPQPEVAPAAPKLPKGVLSSPRKADQEAKLAAEAEARRERAAAREAEAAAKAEAVRQAREAKEAEEAAAREAEAERKAAEEAKDEGPRTLSVRKQRRMVIPQGCSSDEVVVQTESGVRIPLRTLLPIEGASLE